MRVYTMPEGHKVYEIGLHVDTPEKIDRIAEEIHTLSKIGIKDFVFSAAGMDGRTLEIPMNDGEISLEKALELVTEFNFVFPVLFSGVRGMGVMV